MSYARCLKLVERKRKEEKEQKVIEGNNLEKISYFLLFGFARKQNENEKEIIFLCLVLKEKRKENNKIT